ncbi:MAG: DNA modification methylase, partial [Bacteroidetes bacterium]|nr:DNA modification methylase [Bacteroidota bacterium]
IKTNPNNPRIIKDDKYDKLVQSIKEFPKMLEIRPIVVNDEMVVLGGNMRLKACKAAGLSEIPIIKADSLTEEQQREFIIKDNIGFGEWDWEMIANEWDSEELIEWGLDVPDFLIEDSEAKEDDYEIPDEIETDIVLGDLIEIGDHRLLCGDAKDGDAVGKLMDGRLADIVVTDPPYNTGMKGNSNEKARLSQMFNDSFSSKEWEELKTASFNNYNLFTKGECAFYVFIDWRRVAEFKSILEGFADVKNVIVWDKCVHGLGSDYKSTYENIVVGKKGKPEISNRYGLDYQDIWRVQRKMGRDKDHATKKPIELLQKPIIHASKKDDIVLDLFGGSGSTMITSHQLERNAYLMELEPKYCQIIIDRMLNLDSALTVKVNGKEYEPIPA